MTTTEKEYPWNLRDLLTLLFKHKVKIITVFLTVVAVVTAVTFRAVPIYEASSKILVKFGRENVLKPAIASPDGRTPMLLSASREEGINSKVEILKGRNLIEQAIIDLGVNTLYPDLAEKNPTPASGDVSSLEKAILSSERRLSVEAVKASDIISIKFKHNDPLIAAQFVNKLVSVFLDHHLSLYKDSARYAFLDNQVNLQKNILRDSEKTLEDFKRQNDISSIATQQGLLLQQISGVELSLSQTKSEISKNEGELKSLRGDPSTTSARTVMGQETELNPQAMIGLRNRLAELKLEEQELLTKYTAQSTRVIDIRQEIEQAQQLLHKEEKIYHDKAIITIGHTLNALKSAAANQENQLVEYRKRLSSLNSMGLELSGLERQFGINEANYKLYVDQLEEARISSAMDTEQFANISVVEPALPPITPVSPNKKLNVILSIFLGFLVGCGTAVFFEIISHTFDKNEDIKKHLELPVFASIPEPEPYKPLDSKLSQHISKEYISLRHSLISSAENKKVKTVLFCASAKGEGNSTVLSNFGITMASIGNKVLLVDANFRDPSLHNFFELDRKDGLHELLLGEKSLDDVIKQTRFDHLSVITSGVSLSCFFTSQSLNSFIEKVDPFFDWLLFDSPPIHSCSESRTIAAKMDCVVMVTQAESTRWEVAKSAKELIENNKIKVQGVVLNRRKWHIPSWIYKRL